MNIRLLRLSPIFVGAVLGLLLTLLEYAMGHVRAFQFLQRLEWSSFDWRVQHSRSFDQPVSGRLGTVYVDDATLAEMEKKLGIHWPFPRWTHGLVLKELTDQGVAGVAYDIFFITRRENELAPSSSQGKTVSSDGYFAEQLRRNGKVILGASADPLNPRQQLRRPDPLFAEAAAAQGHALRLTDADGVLRRVEPVFVDAQGVKTWQLGLVLAARELGWDLQKAALDPWRIRVPDARGLLHEIPLDGDGRLLIRWVFDPNRARGTEHASFSTMLGALNYRSKNGSALKEPMKNRLVVIGSKGTNPPIVDWGSTPLGPSTPFFSVHWNVANSLLTGSYVRNTNMMVRLAIIWLLVPVVGLISWKLRAVWATLAIALLVAVYLAIAWWSYVKLGWWLPVMMPVVGSVCITHGLMVVFRFFIERSHRKRLRGLFAHLVSPQSLDLLLQQPNVSWAPEERNMTVFFADIRGFTALTDRTASNGGGTGTEHEVLETVNLYLSAVVEALKRHGAILDKYMGDCVMAFWGAPLDQPGHAASAIRAAIEAQSLIRQINEERDMKNHEMEAQNASAAPQNLPPRPLLPKLTLGTGINTGMMTAGFMGADSHLSNFTVFGRAVNIASRLEAASGSGRIFITEETRLAAIASAPELGSRIKEVGNLNLKGIGEPVLVHEIDWADRLEVQG